MATYYANVKAKGKTSSGPGAQGIRMDHFRLATKGQTESAVIEALQKTHPKAANIVVESIEWR